MPRRPSKGRGGGSTSKSFKKSDGKIKKWNTVADIPMDEEDQFHASRDKILLEGESGVNYDEDGDDDEVFALKGLDDESDDEEEFLETEGLEDERKSEDIPDVAKKSKKVKKSKGKAAEKEEEDEEDELEEEESWGRGKAAYYSSNADQLESDDEEGNELEEQEAKRLQIKLREEMKDDDFGLNDNPELERQDDIDDIIDAAPSIIPSLPTDQKGLLRHLEKTSPESLALARDWDETARNLQKSRERIAKLESEEPDALHLGMIHLHYQALLSYSTMLAFYLHLRSTAKYAQRPALLQSHPILQRLLTLKQSLSTLEDLDFAGSDSEDYEDGDEDDYMGMDIDDILADGEHVWSLDPPKTLEPNELADLLNDADLSSEELEPRIKKPAKKKRKVVEEKSKVNSPVFDLVEPEFVSSKSPSTRYHGGDDANHYGESTVLHSADAADKSARKKTLRFHTSKIESASARRQGARNQASGGDDDIPYHRRKSEKDAKLVKEAAARLKNQAGEALNDEDPEPRVGEKRSRMEEDEADGGESPDEYYELVKKRSKEKKEMKKTEHEGAHGRTRVPLEEGEGIGPRSLTRAILSNKGLTPHRPKSVRNPRVKKRQKFEKAQKKISSQKAVYKGGLSESGGRYDGEKSGISKVVKSVRLG
ncbi:Sas10 C-terminal domain-containing protein [Crassisporium funariophilum]|nr:Sas10 C-terminal domain-containing protein [Crassisporium funariophilum]